MFFGKVHELIFTLRVLGIEQMMTFNSKICKSVDRHIIYCLFWQVWQSDETFAVQVLKISKIDVNSMYVNE